MKVIGTGVGIVSANGTISVAVEKTSAVLHDKANRYISLNAKYLGLPLGTKIKVTLEVIEATDPQED